jgi:RsiW-degrading membrane proteinase PrsW (M82 family)
MRTERHHTPAAQRALALRRPWVQTLLGGLALWVILDWATLASKNINLVPSLILLGACLGPVTFVVYVYERVRDVPWPALLQCFVVGGILGVTAASILEYRTLLEYGALPTIAIGLIEETSKLLVPLVIFAVARYRREADGLLIGVASGMGFAAFESMGYGLTALLASHGHIGSVEQVLFTRTVLAPAGHAAWTGLICAALWRARERRTWVIFPLAFVVAVTLHALWDSVASSYGLIPIALVSYGLLAWRLRAVSARPRS